MGDLGLGISNRGILRLLSFFLDLGGAYAAFKPDAPYITAVSNGDLQAFAKRIEQNLLSHIASRYRESKEVSELFTELPSQLIFIRDMVGLETDAPAPENLSAAGKIRTQILLSALRSLRKKP